MRAETESVVNDIKFLQVRDSKWLHDILKNADETDTWQDIDSWIRDRASELRDLDNHYSELYGERDDVRHTLPRPWWWNRSRAAP